MKKILCVCGVAILSTVFVPLIVTFAGGNIGSNVNVHVYEYDGQNIADSEAEVRDDFGVDVDYGSAETVSLEEYIKGVVAAEMPVSFELEALKAQAVAARTYALKRMISSEIEFYNINPNEMSGQAYIDNYSLYTKWGGSYEQYYSKLCEAVDSTKGEVLVYQNELIEAVFHSTSAGMTENSENVWKQALPYLVSVESKEDEAAPDFLHEQTFVADEVISRLYTVNPNLMLESNDLSANMQIIERSEAGYIKLIQIGNIVFTGNEVRAALELRSNNFEFMHNGDEIIFTTKGYGHGVGMSQYGANFLAKGGSNYIDILQHYYNGTQIANIDTI